MSGYGPPRGWRGSNAWGAAPSQSSDTVAGGQAVSGDEARETANLDAWLDVRQADVVHDHDRPGMTPDSCYCGLPQPCEQRADDLAAIEKLRTVLAENARFLAERDDARAVAVLCRQAIDQMPLGMDEFLGTEYDELPDWFTGWNNGRDIWGGGDDD